MPMLRLVPIKDEDTWVVSSIYERFDDYSKETKTGFNLMDTAVGIRNAQNLFNRKVELACMQLIVSTAFRKNIDFHKIVDNLPVSHLGRFDFTDVDFIHMNLTEGEEDSYRMELYNDIGDHIYIVLFKKG